MHVNQPREKLDRQTDVVWPVGCSFVAQELEEHLRIAEKSSYFLYFVLFIEGQRIITTNRDISQEPNPETVENKA
jgi:hypothetical protein